MKKKFPIILTTLMTISFICLLALQARYIFEILEMRREHFEESVSRALYEVAHKLEIEETKSYLTTGQPVTQQRTNLPYVSDKYFTKSNGTNVSDKQSLQEAIAKRYTYEKNLMEEVIYSILYTASDRPIEQRINFDELDNIIKNELANNGLDIPYHFSVLDKNGTIVYQCSDFEPKGNKKIFSETLFKNDPGSKTATLQVHFPGSAKVLYRSMWFMMPSLVFTLILLITVIIVTTLIVRQKKLNEVRNDFINNMTHEFKTPISSISLAAQMLNDDTITKSPQMIKRLTTTISDETKRLRFQVEKVLQMSMYEHQKANLRMEDTNINELIAGIVHTFALKVEKNGGKIITNLQAADPIVFADNMHLTNVIFNIMDNAVKYRRPDAALELNVTTWNEDEKLCISIQDNGIGIKKEDVKRIFDKFYRVHTGNLHDVKGFGLGLAYVHKIIRDHKGTVHAESELGIGTKFIIRLPLA